MERTTVKRTDGRWALANNDRARPMEQMEKIPLAIDRLAAYEDAMPLERAQELAQAEKDGRLAVLDEPRKPLVWGDDEHNSVLCPNCNHDLMGGFPEDEYCENDMYQCPYCGQSIDSAKAITREEAEAALKKREEKEMARNA